MDNKDQMTTPVSELLKDVPVEDLIKELQNRKLTQEQIDNLQLLKAKDEIKGDVPDLQELSKEQITDSAEKYAGLVTRRNVFGKLPVSMKIGEKEIVGQNAGGFVEHGPDNISTDRVGRALQTRIYGARSEYPDLVRSNIINTSDLETDPNLQILTIYFFQDPKAPDSRGAWTSAYVQAELPKTVMGEFITKAKQNPDLLEDFYQRVFPGLDETEGHPGMRRVKSTGFYEVDKANPLATPQTKYSYKNGPYGTGSEYNK